MGQYLWMCVYACYNRCHDSAVKGSGAKYLLSAICWLIGDHLLLRDFSLWALWANIYDYMFTTSFIREG
jgi:hypothetical protein